ncbi:hypothetical protein [Pedobacter puniceum]|uniref:VCBS repeat-containing protein n=1 Tax=Pedobacter puniceum TaxID=2666136 RepID=A0A7K0FLD6_9SPHI|nr:hypothetical protein [Pedobacter puniceum]MRX46622.1 hypothetical protein [Pedobacter puniceum]
MKSILIIFITFLTTTTFAQVKANRNVNDFIPQGFVILEEIKGDLNKDGINDVVLLIKATDKEQFVVDEYRGKLDRNRRGIIILFDKKDSFELALKNLDCFSSEHEDGGVYYAPELAISIKNGNLNISYEHGRYGSWMYVFKAINTDFKLIGYESVYRSNYVFDGITFDETSINFLTKKKLIKEVIKVSSKGKEIYKEFWKKIDVKQLAKLSEIKDFDDIDMSKY